VANFLEVSSCGDLIVARHYYELIHETICELTRFNQGAIVKDPIFFKHQFRGFLFHESRNNQPIWDHGSCHVKLFDRLIRHFYWSFSLYQISNNWAPIYTFNFKISYKLWTVIKSNLSVIISIAYILRAVNPFHSSFIVFYVGSMP
jgi:hypothetical protein